MDKKGFTLIEMIIGLLFVSTIFLLLMGILLQIKNSKESVKFVDQNEIGILNLQHEFNFATDVQWNDEKICYLRLDQQFCLEIRENNLIKTPGYHYFIYDADRLYIQLEDVVKVVLNDKVYEIRYHK